MEPTTDEPPHARAMEEVRAYLAMVRGGGLFLSPADARLLADWLESGVGPGAVLRAIDAVAERRRAKRVRAPFTLTACKGEVKRRRGGAAPVMPPDLAARLAVPDDELARRALAEIAALTGADPEARAMAACAIARRFHDAVWARERTPALLQEAAADLEELRELYSEAEFARACEEHARDRVRRRYPALSATRIWQEFGVHD